jgi:amino-acid N-acetyltransferase
MTLDAAAIAPGDPYWRAFTDLLDRERLPASDLTDSDLRFFVFRAGDEVRAFGGFTIKGRDALLRSLVVAEDTRGSGTGSEVVTMLLRWAKSHDVRTVFLLTTTASAFFARHGFTNCDRSFVPPAIAATGEFNGLCPSTAELMCRTLV